MKLPRFQFRLWMLLLLVALVAACLGVYRWGRGSIQALEMAKWHEQQAGALKSEIMLLDAVHRREGGGAPVQLKLIEGANVIRTRMRDRLNALGKPVPPALEGSLDAKQAEVEANRASWNSWYAAIRPVSVSAMNWHNARAKELRSQWAFLPAWEHYRDQSEFENEMRAVRRIEVANRAGVLEARAQREKAEAGAPEQLAALVKEALRPDSSWPVSLVPDLQNAFEIRIKVELSDRSREANQERIVSQFLRSLPDYYIPKQPVSAAPPAPRPPPPTPPQASSTP